MCGRGWIGNSEGKLEWLCHVATAVMCICGVKMASGKKGVQNHERYVCTGPVIPAAREARKIWRKHDTNHDYGVDWSEYSEGCENDPRLLAILTPGSVRSVCVCPSCLSVCLSVCPCVCLRA